VARIIEHSDSSAFGRLYDRHTPRLFGLALRLNGGDRAGAEDVVHEVWIRAIERLSTFRWQSALSTWLCGFVVNAVRDRARQDARELPGVEEDHPADDLPLLQAADRVDLERAITRLPAGFRHVLLLHDVEGYSHEEIAALLGIVPGTSKSQLARARRAVRRALRPKEH
jgi:RNA polymerase sigma-70 factor, ECF subfamily